MFRLYVLIFWICSINVAFANPTTDPNYPRQLWSGFIFRGKTVDIKEVPYQVSIELASSGNRHFCGGSILSSKHVLTAAHCANRPAANYTIRAGSSTWKDGGSLHKVKKISLHNKFSMDDLGITKNDIAIMTVDPPFKLDETRRIIKLIAAGKKMKKGEVATIAGWGRTSLNSSQSDYLQLARMKIVDLSTCQKAYHNGGGKGKIVGQICTTGTDPQMIADMCYGDNGGALLVRDYQVGIASWSSYCQPQYPGFYTEVAYYRKWIDYNIKL